MDEEIIDHVADVSKMVKLGSGAEREVDDIIKTTAMSEVYWENAGLNQKNFLPRRTLRNWNSA